MPLPGAKARETRSTRGRRYSHSDQDPRSAHSRSDEKPSPSPSKRQKRDHQETTSTPLRSQIMRPDDMYTFTSTVIDLTASPDKNVSGSPLRKVSNGVRSTASTASSGPKKLLVKNFRTTTKSDPEQYYIKLWQELEDALDAIFTRDAKPFSMEHLYRGVENVCRQDKAPRLFQKLQVKCKQHITSNVRNSLVKAIEGKPNTEVLRITVEAWATWRRQMVCE
jgi:hypothetical protein